MPTMHSVILISVALSGALIDPLAVSVEDVIGHLRARHDKLKSISCTYEFTTTPSDYFVEQRSRNDGRPTDSIRGGYMSRMAVDFVETIDGKFKFNLTRMTSAGAFQDRRALYFNGKETFTVSNLFNKGAPSFQDVTVKSENRANYDVEAAARRFLGDTVLPTTEKTLPQLRPLFVQIEQADKREILPSELINGGKCLDIRWYSVADGMERRETVWLDTRYNLAPRRYKEELRRVGSEKWAVTTQWEGDGFGSASFNETEKASTELRFPSDVVLNSYDMEEYLMFTNKYTRIRVVVNSLSPASSFAPKIEDGSNVLDGKTGRGFVYGGKLSPRLRGLIQSQLDESKRDLASKEDPEAANRTVSPQHQWIGVVSSMTLALGVVGLLIAYWMWRRA